MHFDWVSVLKGDVNTGLLAALWWGGPCVVVAVLLDVFFIRLLGLAERD